MTPHQAILDAFFAKDSQEAARLFETFDLHEKIKIIQKTNERNMGNLLIHFTLSSSIEILKALPSDLQVTAIASLAPNEAATLLPHLPQTDQTNILQALPTTKGESIRILLEFPAGTAGHIMNPQVQTLYDDYTVKEALVKVRADQTKTSFDLFVISRENKFVGTLTYEDLIKSDESLFLSSVCTQDLPRIQPLDSEEETVRFFQEGSYHTLPVQNKEGHLLGGLGYKEMAKVMEKANTLPIQTLVGVPKEEEEQTASLWSSIDRRLPWVGINLLTALVVTGILTLFEKTWGITNRMLLFLPLFLLFPASVGLQSHNLKLRLLLCGKPSGFRWQWISLREIQIALIFGGITASTMIILAYAWTLSVHLAAGLGLALGLAVSLAGMVGSSLSFAVDRFKRIPFFLSSVMVSFLIGLISLLSYLCWVRVFTHG